MQEKWNNGVDDAMLPGKVLYNNIAFVMIRMCPQISANEVSHIQQKGKTEAK